MSNLQTKFNTFHKKIKVDIDDQRELAEKRDIIVNKIISTLKKNEHLVPDMINKGSYIHGVGVEPVDPNEEYDIDIGLIFNIMSDDNSAKDVRTWVWDAIKDHSENVENKGPCIRVRYAAGYHVDIAIYARYKSSEDIEDMQLGRKDNTWEETNPEGLKTSIENHKKNFSGSVEDGANQFCRIVRYFKRWNDYYKPKKKDNKPFGLAFVLLVKKELSAPVLDSAGKSDDLEVLIRISQATANTYGRISIQKPVKPWDDVFERIDQSGMDDLKKRFSDLKSELIKARDEEDETKACNILKSIFGDDFPIPMKKSESLDNLSSEDRDLLKADLEAKEIPVTTSPWFKSE